VSDYTFVRMAATADTATSPQQRCPSRSRTDAYVLPGLRDSVIIGRAIPDVRDGLKPVHRRILYTRTSRPAAGGQVYRKSATIVGDVPASTTHTATARCTTPWSGSPKISRCATRS